MRPLTRQQKKVLDVIRDFINQQGIAPSYREIMRELRLSSTATIHQHVAALKSKGYLKSSVGVARSLQPASDLETGHQVYLPLLGTIAAGEPIEALEEREMIGVPDDLVRSDSSYVLRVRGDSMIEDGILDGDYVVVERNYYPSNGDIVVALLDNAYATLKKYYRERDKIRLQPANSSMAPLFAKNPAIQGVVSAIIRKFRSS